MTISIHNSSVLSCLIGIALLMTGFVGFMAHSFSKSTAELEGVRLVDAKQIDQVPTGNKVCIVTNINADDTFEMPDNHQKAIKGRLLLYAVWPDNSQNVLIDWNKQSKFIKIPHGEGGFTYVNPRNIDCEQDTAIKRQLKITKSRNSIEIKYFQYKFNLSGTVTKGEPRIILRRECLADSAKVALTLTKNTARNSKETTIDVSNATPYSSAINKQKGMSNSKIIYIIIGVVGILMFFVPERQAQNTIANTKSIVTKIINDIKD
ncbi:MAG: hypothetical protein IJ894_03700 [Bacteroidales bacterium]|nr:hypothetical protein [Bacteroidales bacterium]MBR2199839.1 hypothetical protein [Bacteroidales bacterium]MBR4272532.1 hypothetical protein [Bacteroidales bacterium]